MEAITATPAGTHLIYSFYTCRNNAESADQDVMLQRTLIAAVRKVLGDIHGT